MEPERRPDPTAVQPLPPQRPAGPSPQAGAQPPDPPHRSWPKRLAIAAGALATLAVLAAVVVGIWVWSVASGAPSIYELEPRTPGKSSVVYAADGSRIGYIRSRLLRDPIALEKVPEQLQQALIAIEDQDFYEHSGLDYSAIVRAGLANLTSGEVQEGASTLTQQLARALYIADPEQTIERKIREAKIALDLEDEHSKEWILTQYLNDVSFGSNDGREAVGVKAAAEVYFNRQPADLDLRRSALLAGLPQSPTMLNPFEHPAAAKARRNDVLEAMLAQGKISEEACKRASAASLGLERGYRYEKVSQPYILDYVEEQLIDAYGEQTVRQGGLSVQTTIDPKLQKLAETSIDDHLSEDGPAMAMAVIDPASGDVLALASSTNYESSQFNLAVQGRRQPGSAFKPFTLTTAIEQGIDPDKTRYEAPEETTLTTPAGEQWQVEGGSGGEADLLEATAQSLNTVYAQLALDVGPEEVATMAAELGITSPLEGVPAETLGGLREGVSPLEITSAYATLANAGEHKSPEIISRVEMPDGSERELEREPSSEVVSDAVAYEVTEALRGVIEGGTGSAAAIGCPAAGKTGTTENNRDAWFVGYTPKLAAGVWVGYPDEEETLGDAGYGGTLAAPVWQQFMSAARDSFCGEFPESKADLDLERLLAGYAIGEPAEEPLPQEDVDEPVPSDPQPVPEPSPSEEQPSPSSQPEPSPDEEDSPDPAPQPETEPTEEQESGFESEPEKAPKAEGKGKGLERESATDTE